MKQMYTSNNTAGKSNVQIDWANAEKTAPVAVQ